jgi:hypothetical protein
MTTIIRWLNYRPVLATLLTLSALLDMVLLGIAYDLSKSDWASWVQAVGSITAICVAIWIARQDTVLRREDGFAVARVVAVTLIHSARTLQIRANDARGVLEISSQIGYPASEIKHALSFIESRTWWSADDLAKLSPLPHGCAVALAEAQSFVHDAIELMNAAMTRSFQQRPYDELLQSVLPAIEALKTAEMVLDAAVARLAAARTQ